MSRSKRKTPITGMTTCESEKQDKRLANRIHRRNIKQLINVELEEYTHTDRREFGFNNVWSFGKDGKQYLRYGKMESEYYIQLMRK